MVVRKILYMGQNYHTSIGGAEITDQLLLESWVTRGGAARALCLGDGPQVVLRGVEVVPVSDHEAMRAEAIAYHPNLIYSEFGTRELGFEIAHALGVPVMTCLHDPRPFCTDLVALASCDQCCSQCIYFDKYHVLRNRALLKQFNRIVAPSQFMADLAMRHLGRNDISVLYPPVHPVSISETVRGTGISMSTAEYIKGADIFLKIAERMPEQTFFLTGRGDAKRCGYDPRRHPNVHVEGMVSQDVFYGRSCMVLMPSRWAEPFGRMAPEAQSAGVLFMGSNVGGIPEAAGEAGVLVDDHLNPDSWVREIKALLNDPERQEALRKLGLNAWQRFDENMLTTKFCEWANELVMQPNVTVSLPPETEFTLPWRVPDLLRFVFYIPLLCSVLGSLLVAVGYSRLFAAIPLLMLLVGVVSVWIFHAGPLAMVKTKTARKSGQKMLIASLLGVLAMPLDFFGTKGAWGAFLMLLLLGGVTIGHRVRIEKERKRFVV